MGIVIYLVSTRTHARTHTHKDRQTHTQTLAPTSHTVTALTHTHTHTHAYTPLTLIESTNCLRILSLWFIAVQHTQAAAPATANSLTPRPRTSPSLDSMRAAARSMTRNESVVQCSYSPPTTFRLSSLVRTFQSSFMRQNF